jgi:hypothetical protein
MDPLVLELTSTSAADSGKGRAARLANIYDHLNSLVLPNFFLRLEVRTEGAQNPPLGGLKRGLVTWIDGLDVDEVAAKVASSSGYLSDPSAPSYLWEQGGWSIEFGVIPRKRGTREPANNSIGVYGMGDATWVNDVAPIRERLRDKARRYGTFGGPFVVAILLSHWGDDDVVVSGAVRRPGVHLPIR